MKEEFEKAICSLQSATEHLRDVSAKIVDAGSITEENKAQIEKMFNVWLELNIGMRLDSFKEQIEQIRADVDDKADNTDIDGYDFDEISEALDTANEASGDIKSVREDLTELTASVSGFEALFHALNIDPGKLADSVAASREPVIKIVKG